MLNLLQRNGKIVVFDINDGSVSVSTYATVLGTLLPHRS